MNDEADIQSGAKVMLHSDGPEMTVQTRSQNLAYCSWEEDGVLRHGTFTLDSLKLVSLPAGEALMRRTPMPAQAPVSALSPTTDEEPPVTPGASDPPAPT